MMADRLRRELPTLHQEHRAIAELCRELAEAARAADNPEIEYFADTLALHAQMEEQVLHPAAVLVGELLRLKLRI